MIWAYWVSAVLGGQITEIKVLGLRLEGTKPLETVLLIWVNNDETSEPGLARGEWGGTEAEGEAMWIWELKINETL